MPLIRGLIIEPTEGSGPKQTHKPCPGPSPMYSAEQSQQKWARQTFNELTPLIQRSN